MQFEIPEYWQALQTPVPVNFSHLAIENYRNHKFDDPLQLYGLIANPEQKGFLEAVAGGDEDTLALVETIRASYEVQKAARKTLETAKATIAETHKNAMRLLRLLDNPITHIRLSNTLQGPRPFELGGVKPGGWGVFKEEDMRDPPRLGYYHVKFPTPSANAVWLHLMHEKISSKEYPEPVPRTRRVPAPAPVTMEAVEEGEIPRLPTPYPMMVDPSELGPPTSASSSTSSTPTPVVSTNPSTKKKQRSPKSPSVELVHPLPTRPLPLPPRPKSAVANNTRSKKKPRGTLVFSGGLASQTGKRTGPPPTSPPKSPTTIKRLVPYPTCRVAGPSAPRTICKPNNTAKCGQCSKMGHSMVFCREYQCQSCYKFMPGHMASECKQWFDDRRRDDDYEDQLDDTAYYNID